MDKKRAPKRLKRSTKAIVLLTLALITVGVIGRGISFTSTSTQNVDRASITIKPVTKGEFKHSLGLRGRVEPDRTVFLDTTSGGRVEKRLVEQGMYVEKGQPLVQLSNTSLQLDVMSREAQVTEQLNFLRNTQMTMETNRLNLKRDLIEIDHQLNHLNRQLRQSKVLHKQGLLAQEQLDELTENLDYFKKKRELTIERQEQENSIRKLQISQLEDSAKMLQNNLVFARKNLTDLLITAPVSGYLSELNVEVGESKNRGSRLGQIDIPGKFKLVIDLDEYYLSQVRLGLPVQLNIGEQLIEVEVTKVDSQVEQSQFSIEVALPTELNNLKRGQSLDAELLLTPTQESEILLPKGAFFNSSGGQWVFVLNSDGTQATRRAIQLGRKNQHYFQVLDGLTPGEQVITSSYSNYDNAQSITFTN